MLLSLCYHACAYLCAKRGSDGLYLKFLWMYVFVELVFWWKQFGYLHAQYLSHII